MKNKVIYLGLIFILGACSINEYVSPSYNEGQGGRQNDVGDLGGFGGVINYEDAGIGGNEIPHCSTCFEVLESGIPEGSSVTWCGMDLYSAWNTMINCLCITNPPTSDCAECWPTHTGSVCVQNPWKDKCNSCFMDICQKEYISCFNN